MWEIFMKQVDLGEPTSFLDHGHLGCTHRECETNKDIVHHFRTMFESRISAGATEKTTQLRETWSEHIYMSNTAQQCRLGLFQDSDFAGDLGDSTSTSGGILCIIGSHADVPISWVCRQQTSVSRSSTKAEIISPNTGLRMDGIPALELWHCVIEVLHSSLNSMQRRASPGRLAA